MPLPADVPGVGDDDVVEDDVSATVERAPKVVTHTASHAVGMCDLSKVAFEVVGVVRQQVKHVADVTVAVAPCACVVPMGSESATQLIVSLIRTAVENIRDGARDDLEKAGALSHGEERGRITVRVTIEDDLVVLEASNNGARMDPELCRRALASDSPTNSTEAPGTPRAQGTLAIAATYVRGAGGEIRIDSAGDGGNVVRALLPASSTTVRRAERSRRAPT